MSELQRREVLAARRRAGHPWHSPPHWDSARTERFLFTAACFEHRPFIGYSVERLAAFEEELLAFVKTECAAVFAWVVLPNHYHLLAQTTDVPAVLHTLSRLHGRTSFQWNREEASRGRKVWYGAAETAMKGERHFWATLNYVHHNPVRHGCVERWQDWPFSSAAQYLETAGRDEAERVWREYPIAEYGKGWDD